MTVWGVATCQEWHDDPASRAALWQGTTDTDRAFGGELEWSLYPHISLCCRGIYDWLDLAELLPLYCRCLFRQGRARQTPADRITPSLLWTCGLGWLREWTVTKVESPVARSGRQPPAAYHQLYPAGTIGYYPLLPLQEFEVTHQLDYMLTSLYIWYLATVYICVYICNKV